MRNEYQTGSESHKNQLKPAILDLEKRINQMRQELDDITKDVRKLEKNKE